MVTIDGQAIDVLLNAVGPGYGQSSWFRFAAQAEKKPAIVGGQVRTASLGKACQSPFADLELYLGSYDIGMIFAKELHTQPMASCAADAVQHCRRFIRVADD